MPPTASRAIAHALPLRLALLASIFVAARVTLTTAAPFVTLPAPATGNASAPQLDTLPSRATSSSPTSRAPAPAPSPSPPPTAPRPWYKTYTTGLFIVVVHLTSTLPWLVIAGFDAIDASYRTSQLVARRLALSTFFLLLGYVCGIVFVVALLLDHRADNAGATRQKGRFDEIATVLVLLIFNLLHVARNVRGWFQFVALRQLHTPFTRLQRNVALSLPVDPDRPPSLSVVAVSPRPRDPFIQGLERLRISSRLIENDFGTHTPLLSPLRGPGGRGAKTARHPHERARADDAWAIALWRAWWTQDTRLHHNEAADLSVDATFRCDTRDDLEDLAFNLIRSKPSGLEPRPTRDGGPPEIPVVTDMRDGVRTRILTKHQWAEALRHYGTTKDRLPGQQDTKGRMPGERMRAHDATAVAILVHEKTNIPPNRMSLLWYDTARFEQVYEDNAFSLETARAAPDVLFPSLAEWQNMAMDISTNLDLPVNLTDKLLVVFAGELAAASVILVRYPREYCELVELVYRDGLNARWTFGWSGLLSCFSHLWTRERVYVAMLNGLTLITLTRYADVKQIDPNVRAMMYGYAAFAVSDRAVGKRVAEDRSKELLYRYRENKGKTCRGSGLNATRIACKLLGLPQEASHMDGMPAFSTGWASEFMERLPGNQEPQHGRTHEEAEKLEGSGQMWRYPHSCG